MSLYAVIHACHWEGGKEGEREGIRDGGTEGRKERHGHSCVNEITQVSKRQVVSNPGPFDPMPYRTTTAPL